MKKYYYDVTEQNDGVSVFSSSVKVIPAGTTVYSMECKDKNEEYGRYAEEYDIHFIFDDSIPKINFYTIPHVDIFAADSFGGFIGTVGHGSDLECDAPICYIDENKNCFLIADSGAEFLIILSNWKSKLKPYLDVIFYESKEEAIKVLEFIDIKKIENRF